MTFPPLMVSLSSRPSRGKVSRRWSMPIKCRIVAWISWTCTLVFDRPQTELVGRAVSAASLDAAAGQNMVKP